MKHRYSGALISLAGPLANLTLFITFCIALSVINAMKYKGVELISFYDGAYYWKMPPDLLFFFTGAYLNLVLFLFNMLPFPILDGWDVFTYIFPPLRKLDSSRELVKGFYLFAFLIIILFINIILSISQIITILFSTPLTLILKSLLEAPK
jgi:Zn-dependent protease